MVVAPYHVSNVLRVYGEQLRQSRTSNTPGKAPAGARDRVQISGQGKKKAFMDRVLNDLIRKIAQYGPKDEFEETLSRDLEEQYGVRVTITRTTPHEIILKIADQKGETVESLFVEDLQLSASGQDASGRAKDNQMI